MDQSPCRDGESCCTLFITLPDLIEATFLSGRYKGIEVELLPAFISEETVEIF